MTEKKQHIYMAIDLKSFYASVECIERKLNPLNTNLVVADNSRSEKTICLAVTPSLKKYGISGRARLFQVIQKITEVNRERKRKLLGKEFTGESCFEDEINKNPQLEVSYITAPPRMALYIEYSTKIYNIYLQYIAPEDIHVYSIDEVFMDVTDYLASYKMTAKELATKIIKNVYEEIGITATAGIGTNLYLCKVAMDIMAKHVAAENGVRIAELNEMSYRKLLWNHQPLTDFWRVGVGYQKKLEAIGIYTMGDIARCSLGKLNDFHNEDLLYKLFGVNAELLIDHAWGWEPCTIADVKAYKPENTSMCSGQVLHSPYDFEKGKLVVCEMADLLALDLVDKQLLTDQLVLTIGYDRDNLTNTDYKGEITIDCYGRKIPKHAHGTINLKTFTSSSKRITEAVMELYERIVNPKLQIRKVTITVNHLENEESVISSTEYEQLELFTDYELLQKEQRRENEELEKERKLQVAMLDVKKKYGKNAILKGMNLLEGATAIERNNQIGGHKA